jgi:membrane protein implicated in regulation of membrane protease activity
MDQWLLWLIVAVLLAVGEMLTLSFFLAPFAGGALVAAIVAGIGLGGAIPWVVFLVVSAVLLVALRPLARAHGRTPPALRTGTAALAGRDATVVERIANQEGVGTIRLDGEIWTARAYLDDEVIEAGEQVQVVEIRGATALVSQ